MTQITPPMAVRPNPEPKLAVEPTLLGPPDLKVPSPNDPNFGDPLAKMMTASGGSGGGGGIGTGRAGIGSGNGGGLGPAPAAAPAAERSVRAPAAWAIRAASIARSRNIPKTPAKPSIKG